VIASIGPATSATLREAGCVVDVEADTHTIAGLLAALEGYAAEHPRSGGGVARPADRP
jgi:uroporphyrinogen-III synthase